MHDTRGCNFCLSEIFIFSVAKDHGFSERMYCNRSQGFLITLLFPPPSSYPCCTFCCIFSCISCVCSCSMVRRLTPSWSSLVNGCAISRSHFLNNQHRVTILYIAWNHLENLTWISELPPPSRDYTWSPSDAPGSTWAACRACPGDRT